MQKKLLLLLSLAVLSQLTFAQFIAVESTELLKLNDNKDCFFPHFSPAGDYILVSGSNYAGLRAYDFSTKATTVITTDAGAGYNSQISADGKTILYTKTDINKNRKTNSLVQIEKATRSKKQLVAPIRETTITIEDRKMVLYKASTPKILSPNGPDESYIWPSISPDGKKIAYTIVGKSSFVCSIDGTNPVSLGYVNAPKWLNNNWLIGMADKDDGEKLISSDLVAVSVDGKKQQKLTIPAGKMALYPSASADGKRIAFSTEKGELYMLTVTIK